MKINNLYEQAMQFYEKNDIKQAKELFLSIIEKDDKHHQSINMLGFILNLEGDFESSSRYIRKAVELAPSEGRYINNLGVLYLKNHKYDESLEVFLEAIKYYPSNSEAYCNLGYIKHLKGDFEESKVFFEKALFYNPQNIMAYIQAAALYRDMNLTSQALGLYSDALHIYPNAVEAYLQRGNLYYELKLFNEALNDYSKAIELEPNIVNTSFIKGTINQIYTQLFPINRFEFYNNFYQLEQYKNAINKLISKDIKVLEYSNVEGIISMLLSKSGVEYIDLIMDEPFLISQAKKLLEKNGLKNRVNIIEKQSNELEFKNDIKEKADLLVVDLFNSIFPTFNDLMKIQYLKKQFLKDDGKIFPYSLRFMIQPIFSKELREKNIANRVLDLDISILDQYRPLFLHEDLKNYEYKLLSEPYEVYNFDLKNTQIKEWEKSISIKVNDYSVCDGFVIWVDKYLDEDIYIDNSPVGMSNQNYYIYLLNEDKTIDDGKVDLKITYSNFPIIEMV